MIKRSFFALSQPRLTYDLLDPDLKEPEIIPVPASLTLLLAETIDSTKQSLFKKGDAVKKGEKLKLYEGDTAYVISPVAGTIKGFDSYSDDFGNLSTYILIKPDPAKTSQEDKIALDPVEDLKFADAFLRDLPGAPPFKALAHENAAIDTIVITGADTDILSTTSQYICTAYTAELLEGAKILKRMSKVSKFFITIPEDLDPQLNFGSIQTLKTSINYPATIPAMVLKDHLNKVLAPGNTPEDLGITFVRAEALVSIAKVFATKAQVFEKVVTLIDKTKERHVLKATIGTPLSKIFARFNVHINEKDRIIIGGPMKGVATFTPHHPILPDIDTVIVQDRDIIPELSDTPCVNCGDCIRICPANVPVNLLVRYLEADQYEEAADQFDLESCIECGLCAYVCKARIPIYQYIRLGKHELLTLRADTADA